MRSLGVGNLHGGLQAIAKPHAATGKALIERTAVDELHGDEIGVSVLADFMDSYYVRVVRRGGGAGFLKKTLPAVVVGDLCGSKKFDGDGTIEQRIARLADNAHAALAELVLNLEMGERPARHFTGSRLSRRRRWLGSLRDTGQRYSASADCR